MTRITMTSAVAALTITLASAAQAYGTAPTSSLPADLADGDTCSMPLPADLAALLNAPGVSVATC